MKSKNDLSKSTDRFSNSASGIKYLYKAKRPLNQKTTHREFYQNDEYSVDIELEDKPEISGKHKIKNNFKPSTKQTVDQNEYKKLKKKYDFEEIEEQSEEDIPKDDKEDDENNNDSHQKKSKKGSETPPSRKRKNNIYTEQYRPNKNKIISDEDDEEDIKNIDNNKKENEMNIYSKDYIFKEEVKKGIHHPMTEEEKKRVTEILIKYFQTRGDAGSILRKYFTIWRRKANYLTCLENAKIITDFCRENLYRNINYRKWKKICEKLILKERLKIIKLTRVENVKRNKIFDLIRLTRINSVLAKRRYLHYIILSWLAYTRNINRKRKHVKALYENMLNTYMHMADDVFGNNQKENPSVQDALFEAVESDKFHTKDARDVPVAEQYYVDKKEIKKVTTNVTYINNNNNDNEPKEYVTYKAYISKHPLATSSSSGNIKEKVVKQKVIKVGAGERLQSRGRGRKYRTKVEKEILNKFYDDKKFYSKIMKEEVKEGEEEENKDKDIKDIIIDDDNYGNNNFKGNKSVKITMTTTSKVVSNNNVGGGYNNEMSSRKKRALYGVSYKKEDEKEMEEGEK